jgi:2-keto-4-pentenoate hydratase
VSGAAEGGERCERAARWLLAWRAHGPGPPGLPAECAPANEREAYAVQGYVTQDLGAQIGGWKASLSGPDQGTAAPIFLQELYRSPAQVGSNIASALGIEPEVAFCLREDLPPRPGGVRYARSEIIAAIASAHCAIEILVSRFQSHEGATPLDRLADNISNAGLVLAAPCYDWQRLDLQLLPLQLAIRPESGPAIEYDARGGHPQSDPLMPLVWLINALSQRGIGARAGDVITTGSYAGLRYAPRGAQVRVQFAGLGTALLKVLT